MPATAGNNNWSVNTGGLTGAGTGSSVYGGGGDPQAMQTGSRLDRLRMGAGQLPDAQYPDGYLGSVQNRYSGKKDGNAALLANRLSDRSYQRGVHKATKMSPSDYLWPSDFGPDSGLKNQARGKLGPDGTILVPQYAPPGNPVDKFSAGIASEREMMQLYSRYGINAHTGQGTDSVDPARAQIIAGMLPQTSW